MTYSMNMSSCQIIMLTYDLTCCMPTLLCYMSNNYVDMLTKITRMLT